MLRYCKNCKKDFEFAPLDVSGEAPLICPECGNVIEKNSRNPEKKLDSEKTDERIGNVFANLMHLSYIFYMIIGLIGTISYLLGIYALLYIATAVSLAAFILQLITGTVTFTTGVFFIPAGAVAGFVFLQGIPGACLGVHIVFLIRHLIRDIFFRLIWKLLGKNSD